MRRAFTLVELWVVIAIIGVLVSLLLPAMQAARESARRAECANNLKQLGLGLQGFHGAHEHLPLGVYGGVQGLGWGAKILPYIEENAVYEQINSLSTTIPLPGIRDPWKHEPFEAALRIGHLVPGGDALLPTFICPSGDLPMHVPDPPQGGLLSAGYARSSYRGSRGYWFDGAFVPESVIGNEIKYSVYGPGIGLVDSGHKRSYHRVKHKNIHDGLSNTIAIGESDHVYAPSFWPLWIGSSEHHPYGPQTLLATTSRINCGVRPGIGIWGDRERSIALEVSGEEGRANTCAYSSHERGAYFAF